jgi:hypothetical protein
MRNTSSGSRKAFWVAALAGGLWLSAPSAQAQNETLNGTYTIQGQKGAVTLLLTQTAAGLEGTLKGGDLSLVLKGFPRPEGGFMGTASTADGQFASYFLATRQGKQLVLDLVQANADGDPDLTQTSRITFPAANAPATPATGNAETTPPDEETAVTVENTPEEAAAPEGAVAEGAAQNTFGGRWQGEGLTLDARPQANGYTGTLTLNGQAMPFTASPVNGVLHGTFTAGEDRFDFQARLQNGALVLSSGETTYRLSKPGAANKPANATKANPLAAKKKPAAPARPATAAPASSKPSPTQPMTPQSTSDGRPGGAPKGGEAWKTFSHPTGLSLRYPADWNAQDAGGILLLTPSGVKQIGGGPAELFLVKADASGGIASGDDPRLEAAIAGFIAQNYPAFQRSGETKRLRIGSQPGILMEWVGETQGHPMRVQVMSTILKNFAVSMMAASIRSEIKPARDQAARQIFESLVAGAGEKDRQVVGKWFLYSYKGSGTYGRETKSYLTLVADGTALWGQNSESSFSSAAGGFASQGNSGDRGTWSAGKGQLIVSWGDGTIAAWTYRVGGNAGGNRRLFLSTGDKTDEWMEVQ